MKLKITAVAVALASLSSVAQADVLVAPSFNDAADLATLPNVTQTVTVQQIPAPSFQDADSAAYGYVVNATSYEIRGFNG